MSGITEKEVRENRQLQRLVGLKTGKSGLEKSLDVSLRGIVGKERIEVNSRGKPVRFISDRLLKSGALVGVDVVGCCVEALIYCDGVRY